MSLINKQIGIIGIGNCGSQVAYLAEQTIPDLIDAIYINTSDADLSMVGDSEYKCKIGEDAEGSGKNRDATKQHLKQSLKEILNNEKIRDLIASKKYIYVVSSTAGGTGSGAAPILFKILKELFVETNFILIAVLPQLNASLLEQVNTMEYLDELYTKLPEDTTYMIYDNETTKNLSATQGLIEINKAVVDDIRILSGIDNHPTPYESIDEADMETIITTPGRLIVAKITKGLTEKMMEDDQTDEKIIKAIKSSQHCELNRDKKILRCGIITFLTEQCNNLYNSSLDKLFEFLGTPAEIFNHNALNNDSETMNYLYFIASGLSNIVDRIARINLRIEELEAALKSAKEVKETGIDSATINELKRFKNTKGRINDEQIDIDAIFSSFEK